MEGLELISFQIISMVGTARSCYIEAIKASRIGRFEEAEKLLKEGAEAFSQGHKCHMQLLQKESQGESVQVNLLLMHAEDQLMSAENFKILAEEFIALNKMIYENR